MKKTYYEFEEKISPNAYLHYNAFSNQFLLLNKQKQDIWSKYDCREIEKREPIFFKKLLEASFIIPEDFNEFEISKYRRSKMQYDSSMYHIVINTTLDCNLNCWYCYENRISGSKLKDEVIEAIKKNLEVEYSLTPFNTLKLSFFGGEPFLNFDGIKKILSITKEFCDTKNIELIADFTTNATLINEQQINFLKDFRCHFQITFDGDRPIHNKIKRDILKPETDTYQKTINTLQCINETINSRWIAIRINFSNRTLEKIEEIINDINFMDRRYTYVILKKVWQISKEKIDTLLLHTAIQKFFDNKFLLDYYIMPKGHICFAERDREVLFNFDGQVFKCSTISSFDEKESLGKLDLSTGRLEWDLSKISYWQKDMLQDKCIKCKWLPACLGPCNRQLLAHKGNFICTFDSINMNTKEFLIYAFKFHLLKEELNKLEE